VQWWSELLVGAATKESKQLQLRLVPNNLALRANRPCSDEK
jgi:hypothetical protein